MMCLLFRSLSLGASGLISVASNVIPGEMALMTHAATIGDWETARGINRRHYRLMQSLFVEPSPAPVKAVLNLDGKVGGDFALAACPRLCDDSPDVERAG